MGKSLIALRMNGGYVYHFIPKTFNYYRMYASNFERFWPVYENAPPSNCDST